MGSVSVYQQLLSNNFKGAVFLFDSRFREGLQDGLDKLSSEYELDVESAVEELRRFFVIKAFTVDTYATKISPTPLSK